MDSEKLAKAIEQFVFQAIMANKLGSESFEEHTAKIEGNRAALEQGILEAQQEND